MATRWQRTPEGRARLAESAREQWRSGRGLGSPATRRKRRDGVKRAAARKRRERGTTQAPTPSTSTALAVRPTRSRARVIHVDPIPQADPLDLLAHTVVGTIFATIDNYARSARVPSAVLAERVYGLLSASVRR